MSTTKNRYWKLTGIKLFTFFSILALTLALFGCNIEKEEEGELPDVDVEAEAGKLPDYEIVKKEEGELPEVDVDVDAGKLPDFDIEFADIDVGVTKRTIKVPKVVVVMEEQEVQVPYIDIDMPGDNDSVDNEDASSNADKRKDWDETEKTLTVEVEVPSPNYDVEIEKIYLVKDKYIVLAQLDKGDDGDQAVQKTVRISDRVVLSGPDLDVRYYIIGERPRGNYNEQYRFIENEDDIEDTLSNGKVLWEG